MELKTIASNYKANSFLQSALWGEFKSCFNWNPFYFLLEIDKKKSPLLVLNRKIIRGFSFAYIPWGPEIECSAEELCELAEELKPHLPHDTVFIRYDLPRNSDQRTMNNEQKTIKECKQLKKAPVYVQAPDTVIINLDKSCEEILTDMKSKCRYNINLASKKSVEINGKWKMENGKLEIFYKLLEETAKRDGIAIHSFEYYKTLFELCEKNPDADICLYSAVHEGDTIAAIIVLFYGRTATYLYGASSNVKRNLMAPYALQWQAMQDAKEKGCLYYDLFGIPPNEDPKHPMAGLYRFKTGFGGQIIHRPGCYDYAYKPLAYGLFSFAEKLRKQIPSR